MKWFPLVVLAALAPAATTHADDAPVELALTPWARHDGIERPFRYIVEIRPRGADAIEVVADRRLLSFQVRPHEGRRRFACRAPAVPARVSTARSRTLRTGDGEDARWREWIDLRMYCTGRALAALEGGAIVEVRYGWPRRSRTRWVARRPGAPEREWVALLEAPEFEFPAVRRETRTTTHGGETSSPIEVELAPTSARTGAALVLRTAVRARDGTQRVYVRPDAWSFRVRGPLGDVVCRGEPGGGSPPPELFQRITPRAAVRLALDADFFCPEHTFELAGVYEITPELTLPHSGEEWGLAAVTGTFVGPTVAVRITQGGLAYLEQVPERAEENGEGGNGE